MSGDIALIDSPLAEYEARKLATEMNLRRYANELLAVIRASQNDDLDEDEAFSALKELDETWARLIVDDLAPQKNLLS
jgi:hypothetical protein